MMVGFALVCSVFGGLLLGGADAVPQPPSILPYTVSAITGNGGLTVCVGPGATVTACRWPSPSYYGQLPASLGTGSDPDGTPGSPQTPAWGIRTNGQTQWLSDAPSLGLPRYVSPDSTAVEVVHSLPETGTAVKQILFVHPIEDVFVSHIEIDATGQDPVLYWFAPWAPGTRLIPELAFADEILDVCGDSVAFAADDSQTIYHFRPDSADAKDWQDAERWVSEGQSPDEGKHSLFREGVWIGYTTPNGVSSFQCGNRGATTCAYRLATEGLLARQTGAVGRCNSAMALTPRKTDIEGRSAATVFVAFGKSRAEVDRGLAFARERGFAALLNETDQYWKAWLARAELPAAEDAEVPALCKRFLLTIAQAMDRKTGAIVSQTYGRSALDRFRDGAWIAYALDLAGCTDLAEKHTLFCAGTVRRTDARGKPRGSFPAACYADGTEGLPPLVLDVESAAWTLWSFWQHSAFLQPPRRSDYLEQVWPAVELAGEFLVHWADERTGEPLHSFDPEKCRDAKSPNLFLTVYLGVDSALRIARTLGHDPPEWAGRELELRALIRNRCLDAEGNWRVLPPWPIDIRLPSAPSWDALANRRLADLAGRHGEACARDLANVALLWRNRPDDLAQLEPLLRPTLENILYNAPENPVCGVCPDPLTAALAYIAAYTISERGG